ncbi:MAG: PQQ-binding-like beta-propeller repeat protein [Polyangiaceae bacterium]
MSQYRDVPPRAALIWATRNELFAVDPESGALRWRADVPDLRRMFRCETALLVVAEKGVWFIDEASGKTVRQVKLEFVPTAALLAGERLYVAGPEGSIALTVSGERLWSAKREFKGGFSAQQLYSCKDAGGQELWRELIAAAGGRDNPGLMLGDLTAQPDLDFN